MYHIVIRDDRNCMAYTLLISPYTKRKQGRGGTAPIIQQTDCLTSVAHHKLHPVIQRCAQRCARNFISQQVLQLYLLQLSKILCRSLYFEALFLIFSYYDLSNTFQHIQCININIPVIMYISSDSFNFQRNQKQNIAILQRALVNNVQQRFCKWRI